MTPEREASDPDGGAGASYPIFGATLAAASAGSGEIDFGALAASDGIVIQGIDAGDNSGESVSTAGDVDDDGKDDVIVGASGVNGSMGSTTWSSAQRWNPPRPGPA